MVHKEMLDQEELQLQDLKDQQDVKDQKDQ
jgi:hypothetical protein